MLASACLDVAEERAVLDARVGRADGNGVTLLVRDGLAAVTALGPSGGALWMGAPSALLELSFAPGAAPLTLDFDNVMPGSLLSGPAGAVTALGGMPGRRSRWQVQPPAEGGAVSLVFGPPDAAQARPFRFLAFADVQEAIGRVQEVYRRMNQVPAARFVIMAGDLTQQGSQGELLRFKDELAGLELPLYATLGNHELGDRPDGYQLHFGRGNAHFGFAGVQFTLLDSASATIAPTVYDWLTGWLTEGRRAVHVVAMHICPIDPIGPRNGSFASRAEASKLLAMLADGAVDLTLYGHVHSYYSFSNAGIPAYISGGGGAIPERFDGVGRHFLSIDVDPVTGIQRVDLVRVD